MTAFPWSEVYLVGVESVDRQHRALVETVGRVQLEIASQASLAELKHSFDELYAITEEHFRHEEYLFTGTRFHRARHHRREHDHLLLILDRFCDGLDGRRLTAQPEAHIQFLRDWLIDHIRNEDYMMGVHLNSLAKR